MSGICWPTVYDAEPTLAQYWVTVSCLTPRRMWASVTDGGPTLTQAQCRSIRLKVYSSGGPRVVVSTAALHARVRGSSPGLGGLKEKEVACSASDRQGSNFESCVWRAVSSQSSHQPQVLLAQFSLYVHKGGLKPDSLHFSF